MLMAEPAAPATVAVVVPAPVVVPVAAAPAAFLPAVLDPVAAACTEVETADRLFVGDT